MPTVWQAQDSLWSFPSVGVGEIPLRTHLSLHCPPREGASASPRKGQGQGRVLPGLGEGGKDNSFVGTEPLLLEMDHTQLDKYYKNLHIFLFINPHVCRAHPGTTCSGFLFSSTFPATAGTDCSKGPPKSPPQTQLQSPWGRERLQTRGWRASWALGFLASVAGSQRLLGAQHTAA